MRHSPFAEHETSAVLPKAARRPDESISVGGPSERSLCQSIFLDQQIVEAENRRCASKALNFDGLVPGRRAEVPLGSAKVSLGNQVCIKNWATN